nr:MAG TPA: hypothetical protein [Caudoviricetes sp.]
MNQLLSFAYPLFLNNSFNIICNVLLCGFALIGFIKSPSLF